MYRDTQNIQQGTSTVVTSRFHVQHQGPVASLQDYYISSRFHEDDVLRGVY